MRPSGYLVTWDSRSEPCDNWDKNRTCCSTREEAEDAPKYDGACARCGRGAAEIKNVLIQPLYKGKT